MENIQVLLATRRRVAAAVAGRRYRAPRAADRLRQAASGCGSEDARRSAAARAPAGCASTPPNRRPSHVDPKKTLRCRDRGNWVAVRWSWGGPGVGTCSFQRIGQMTGLSRAPEELRRSAKPAKLEALKCVRQRLLKSLGQRSRASRRHVDPSGPSRSKKSRPELRAAAPTRSHIIGTACAQRLFGRTMKGPPPEVNALGCSRG
jgi:hypothetical protein